MQISKSASPDAARVQLTGGRKGLRMKVSSFGSLTKSIPAGLVPAVFFLWHDNLQLWIGLPQRGDHTGTFADLFKSSCQAHDLLRLQVAKSV
jgi:hypothetical protein